MKSDFATRNNLFHVQPMDILSLYFCDLATRETNTYPRCRAITSREKTWEEA